MEVKVKGVLVEMKRGARIEKRIREVRMIFQEIVDLRNEQGVERNVIHRCQSIVRLMRIKEEVQGIERKRVREDSKFMLSSFMTVINYVFFVIYFFFGRL